jgi:Bacterial SH3 domain
VAHPRHKHVLRAVKPRRRAIRVGLPIAAVLALGTPAAAVVWPDKEPVEAISMARAEAAKVRATPVPVRVAPISRSEGRVRLEEKPPEVTGHKFATTRLNVRAEPSEKAPLLDVLEWAEKIAVSGETEGEWAEVVIDEKSFWVHKAYLAEEKPKPEPEPEPEEESAESAPVGISAAECPSGSDVESGLAANAISVHRAVCAAFPEVTSYGGVRPGDDGEHGTGQALDIMITGSTGDQIAEFVRANASELGVSEVLWSQQIWTVDRSSEGWRYMEDRGSTTANHYDHVHVTVY